MAYQDGWKTINGNHVYFEGGVITKGPSALVGKDYNAAMNTEKQKKPSKQKNYIKENKKEKKSRLTEQKYQLDEDKDMPEESAKVSKELDNMDDHYIRETESVKKAREINKQYRNSLNKTQYSQEDLDRVYAEEDYTEVINSLSQKELAKMKEASRDMNMLTPGTPGHKQAKDYFQEMENTAAGRFLDKRMAENSAKKEKMNKMGATNYLMEKQRSKGNFKDEKTNPLQQKADKVVTGMKKSNNDDWERKIMEDYNRFHGKTDKEISDAKDAVDITKASQHLKFAEKQLYTVYDKKLGIGRKARNDAKIAYNEALRSYNKVASEAYKNYIKDHPNSKMSEDEFKRKHRG